MTHEERIHFTVSNAIYLLKKFSFKKNIHPYNSITNDVLNSRHLNSMDKLYIISTYYYNFEKIFFPRNF